MVTGLALLFSKVAASVLFACKNSIDSAFASRPFSMQESKLMSVEKEDSSSPVLMLKFTAPISMMTGLKESAWVHSRSSMMWVWGLFRIHDDGFEGVGMGAFEVEHDVGMGALSDP